MTDLRALPAHDFGFPHLDLWLNEGVYRIYIYIYDNICIIKILINNDIENNTYIYFGTL